MRRKGYSAGLLCRLSPHNRNSYKLASCECCFVEDKRGRVPARNLRRVLLRDIMKEDLRVPIFSINVDDILQDFIPLTSAKVFPCWYPEMGKSRWRKTLLRQIGSQHVVTFVGTKLVSRNTMWCMVHFSLTWDLKAGKHRPSFLFSKYHLRLMRRPNSYTGSDHRVELPQTCEMPGGDCAISL